MKQEAEQTQLSRNHNQEPVYSQFPATNQILTFPAEKQLNFRRQFRQIKSVLKFLQKA